MFNRSSVRFFLLVSGILTVTVIFLSQSFYRPANESVAVAKAKADGKSEKEMLTKAPADVLPQGNAIQIDDCIPAVVVAPSFVDRFHQVAAQTGRSISTFLINLFGHLIAPNAP